MASGDETKVHLPGRRRRRRVGVGVVAAAAARVVRSSSSQPSSVRVFLEVAIDGAPVGRLEFALRPDLAPRTCENFAALAAGSSAGIDPALTYEGCAFEPYSGKYTYTCKGNGKHVFGNGKFVEREAMSETRRATPGAGGGVYYGRGRRRVDPRWMF